MHNSKRKTFYFVLIVLLFSCEKETKLEYAFPLRENNSWNYSINKSIKNIQVISSVIPIRDTFQILNREIYVSDEINNNGIIEYQINSVGNYEYLTNTPEGLKLCMPGFGDPGLGATHLFPMYIEKRLFSTWFMNRQKSATSIQESESCETLIKYPLKVGSSWISQESSNPKQGSVVKEVIGEEILKTKAGTFYCFKIRSDYSFDDVSFTIEYFAEGYGLIKRETNVFQAEADTYEIEYDGTRHNYVLTGQYIVDYQEIWELECFNLH